MDTERKLYFPEWFGEDLNYLAKMREHLELICEEQEEITEEGQSRLAILEAYFLDLQKPKSFNPYDPKNILMEGEAHFEDVCASLNEAGIHDPKELSEYEFYSRLRYFDKKAKEMDKLTKGR